MQKIRSTIVSKHDALLKQWQKEGPHCTWTLAHICLKKLLGSNDVNIQPPSTREIIRQAAPRVLPHSVEKDRIRKLHFSCISFAPLMQEIDSSSSQNGLLWVDQLTEVHSFLTSFSLFPQLFSSIHLQVCSAFRIFKSSNNIVRTKVSIMIINKCHMPSTVLSTLHEIIKFNLHI